MLLWKSNMPGFFCLSTDPQRHFTTNDITSPGPSVLSNFKLGYQIWYMVYDFGASQYTVKINNTKINPPTCTLGFSVSISQWRSFFFFFPNGDLDGWEIHIWRNSTGSRELFISPITWQDFLERYNHTSKIVTLFHGSLKGHMKMCQCLLWGIGNQVIKDPRKTRKLRKSFQKKT